MEYRYHVNADLRWLASKVRNHDIPSEGKPFTLSHLSDIYPTMCADDSRTDSDRLQSMQSLDRAMLILRAVAARRSLGAKLADISNETCLSRSTAHRFLGALVQAGLLEQEPTGGSYFLGLELCEFGAIAANRFGLRDAAHPSMGRLTEQTQDTVYMSIRHKYESICIERFEGDYPIKTLTLDIGDRRPLGVGAGSLALLAFQSDEFVSRAIALNATEAERKWNLSATQLFDFVAETREQGYALNPGRVAPGMTAVGVPIFGESGEAVAALGVGAISSRMGSERCRQIVALMQEEAGKVAERLSRRLGPLDAQVVNRAYRAGLRNHR